MDKREYIRTISSIKSCTCAYDFFGFDLALWKKFALKYHPDRNSDPETKLVFQLGAELKEKVPKELPKPVVIGRCELKAISRFNFESITYQIDNKLNFVIAYDLKTSSFVEASYNIGIKLSKPPPKLEVLHETVKFSFPEVSTLTKVNGRFGYVEHVPTNRVVTIQQLKNQYFPEGVPRAHIYWIMRKLLLALWYIHESGYAHCGINPKSILVMPKEHNVMFNGYGSFRLLNYQKVWMRPSLYKNFQLETTTVTTKLDFHSCKELMKYMVGKNTEHIPSEIFDVFDSGLSVDQMYETLGKLFIKFHGPREYKELKLWDK